MSNPNGSRKDGETFGRGQQSTPILCVGYLVGGRDGGWAYDFMQDCAVRIKGRVQITTDGHKAYLEAVEGAFGSDVDYAQLQKIFGTRSMPISAVIPRPNAPELT